MLTCAVLRNPVLFVLILLMGGGTYVAYTLNLLGPMSQMGGAAWNQAVDIGKAKLREFVENNETVKQAIAMPAANGRRNRDSIRMDSLDRGGKKTTAYDDDDDM